jgi:curved DNA-binding protein CbpA
MAWAATFDPFEALGLERDANPRLIKAQYYELARRYHPNRNQGSDESKAALSEHFYHLHQAWNLLREADKRRRCLELLELLDQQELVFAHCADLFEATEQLEQHAVNKGSVDGGHVSSDADEDDEDLPRAVGVRRRDTFDKQPRRSISGLDDIAEGTASTYKGVARGRQGKPLAHKLKGSGRSDKEEESSDNNRAAERRRKLDKLRRKELDAFTKYRDAMVDKFDAEAAAERYREHFEQAKWRRQYFERAPKETSQRVRMTQLMSTAIKALTTQKSIKPGRKGSIAGIPNSTLTPIEPIETNQFLSLPSRTKTHHRRGYSSDISGDQTSSSEEGSSDKQTSPSRSPGLPSRSFQRKHRRLDSGPILPPLPIPQHCLPNGKHDPISPITGPGPKLLVRAPTTLGEIFDAQGSDVDTASASSRSPSPQPAPRDDPNKFVLVPTQGASDVFGTERDRKARSPSADRRAASRNGSATLARTPAPESYLFQIKQIGHLKHKHIPMENVHELTEIEKQWMLGVEPDTSMNPAALLDAVSSLDQNLSQLLMVKEDIKELFNFRLIYSHREVIKQQHQTFIALSYRRKLHVEKKEHKNYRYYTLPLEPEMFQAVWDERVSDTEGVWIDQICIDGESEQEKTISMSAMDMVYRSARLVVVALDDVQLDANEGSTLENHMLDFERQTHIPPRKRGSL